MDEVTDVFSPEYDRLDEFAGILSDESDNLDVTGVFSDELDNFEVVLNGV